jgi:hypothetical protein
MRLHYLISTGKGKPTSIPAAMTSRSASIRLGQESSISIGDTSRKGNLRPLRTHWSGYFSEGHVRRPSRAVQIGL